MLYRKLLLASSTAAALLLSAGASSAQNIIKSPGQHPQGPEIEPHLLLRPIYNDEDLRPGLGARFTWQFGRNNFIDSINNSVGLGVGIDWVRYGYRYKCNKDGCYDTDASWVFVPIVMQWSFYVTKSWSFFGEPGILLTLFDHYCDSSNRCEDKRFAFGHRRGADNFIMHVGARWHFKENIALTMRVGYPYWSVGVSFM